jgi:hypothetical protein
MPALPAHDALAQSAACACPWRSARMHTAQVSGCGCPPPRLVSHSFPFSERSAGAVGPDDSLGVMSSVSFEAMLSLYKQLVPHCTAFLARLCVRYCSPRLACPRTRPRAASHSVCAAPYAMRASCSRRGSETSERSSASTPRRARRSRLPPRKHSASGHTTMPSFLRCAPARAWVKVCAAQLVAQVSGTTVLDSTKRASVLRSVALSLGGAAKSPAAAAPAPSAEVRRCALRAGRHVGAHRWTCPRS